MSLPLPLAPFEDYMLFDDRPTHPMSFFIRLKLSGECDTSAFDVALRRALARHPLLTATAQKSGRHGFVWQPLDPDDASVCWQSNSDDNKPVAYLDLSQRSGLEVIGTRTEVGIELLFQFHHSCCDAMGALQLIEDVLVAYAGRVDKLSDSNNLPTLAECQLQNRAKLGLGVWGLLRTAHKQAVGLIGARECMMRVPTTLTPVEPEDLSAALPQTYPDCVWHEFTATETQHIFAAARKEETTVNNLLARDLFIAIHQFQKQLGVDDSRRWVRLLIPINLRRPGIKSCSAANCVSMLFLDRRPNAIRDEQNLLVGIHRQMNRIKKLDLGLTMPLLLKLIKPLGILASLEGDEQCRSTAVLSNLMRPLGKCRLPRDGEKIIAGNLKLEGVEFMPPVRTKTHVAFGVLTYAGRLCVTQHFDPRVVSRADAQQLLDIYVACLMASAEKK